MKSIKLHSLNLELPEINSASSLLNIRERVYVCCDDQYTLYELLDGENWIQHHWLEAPDLPNEVQARKKLKPDFEALLGPVFNNSKILLIPSGSKDKRKKILQFDLLSNKFSPFESQDFYSSLKNEVGLINLEGAAVFGENYLFLNRGIKNNLSSIIKVNSNLFTITSIAEIDFGTIEGIYLHGSELCIFENYLYVLAVAEDSINSYEDGKVFGSSLLKLSLDNYQILDQWIFDKTIKAEGLCRFQNKWLVATDPDGIGKSQFFSFSLL